MSNLNELINNGMLKYADKKGMGIEKLPLTNADKIRSMSDEELSKFLHDLSYDFINEHYLHELYDEYTSFGNDAHLCYVKWLKREVSE